MGSFVEWSDQYILGVSLMDKQHKELVRLTNDLFEACLEGKEEADKNFQEAVRRAVDYVKTHFHDEEELQRDVNYPNFSVHKIDHERFIAAILEYVKAYQTGQKFVPNQFVRYLRDWLLEHIAISDKEFARYYKKVNN